MTLSTHVLDTAHGRPAAAMELMLIRGDILLFHGRTDRDGRCPALRELDVPAGTYSLRFAVADYFRSAGLSLPEPPFLDWVTIDFGMSDGEGHYHVPLLVSPFAFSTYRGS